MVKTQPIECCGQVRNTPFCPNCGRMLAYNRPAIGLLVQCRKNLKGQESKLKDLIAKKTRFASREYYLERLASQEKAIEKWKEWIADLELLLKQQSPDTEE